MLLSVERSAPDVAPAQSNYADLTGHTWTDDKLWSVVNVTPAVAATDR